MLVREWMARPVHAVKPLDTVEHAREQMEKLRINQMPVILDGELVGIITDRDLRDASPSVFEGQGRRRKPAAGADPKTIAVEDVMSAGVVTLGPAESIAEAAAVMRRERIGAVPVVEGGRVVGILTRSDLLKALVAMAEAADPPEARSKTSSS